MQNNKSLRGTVRVVRAAAVTAAALLLGGLPAQAHHSITGEFDTETTFEIQGTLTKLDWANPHLWYYLDVTTANGSVEQWQCTTGINPNRLIRLGWKKEDLPAGTVIKSERANPARNDPHTCYVGSITLEDGTPIFSGPRNPQ
ncbi:MAG: DUF6152 family protein [Pseudomonadota bacterium]|nr:DUF6152 family protein [Pseudomonadota bacterium]